jgi:dephospho-CoA kinase
MQAMVLSFMKLIGLTGGVACGKTTVSNQLEKLGFPVIDADLIARDLLSKDVQIGAKVEKEFGTKDRAQLRQLIFNDLDKRVILERILHPRVGDEIQNRVSDLTHSKKPPKAVILSVPLLFESNWERLVDFTIAVISKKDAQLSRLQKRDEIGTDLAKKMVAAQLPNTEKAKRATFVIENDGSLADLETTVKKTLKEVEKKISQ